MIELNNVNDQIILTILSDVEKCSNFLLEKNETDFTKHSLIILENSIYHSSGLFTHLKSEIEDICWGLASKNPDYKKLSSSFKENCIKYCRTYMT